MRGGYLTLFAGGDFNFAGIGSATLLAEFDARQVFSDTALTTPQSTDGGAVGGWKDIANNTHHLVQASGASQPIYKPNIFGGRPAIRFNGTNQWIGNNTTSIGAFASGDDKPLAVYCVAKLIAYVANGCYWAFGNSASGNSHVVFFTNSDFKFYFSDNTPLTNATGTIPRDTNAHVIGCRFNATRRRLTVDATAASEASVNLGAITLNKFALGALWRTGLGNYQNVDIGRVLVYSSDVSDADDAIIRAALKAEYGTP